MDVIVIESGAFKEIIAKIDSLQQVINNQSAILDRLVDNEQFIVEMKISRRTAQVWRDEGLINFYQIDRKIYYRQSDIDSFFRKAQGADIQKVMDC